MPADAWNRRSNPCWLRARRRTFWSWDRAASAGSRACSSSTTLNVMPYAECPVVVIHSHSEDEQPEIPEGEGNPGQVVLGCDGSGGREPCRGIRLPARRRHRLQCRRRDGGSGADRPESREVDPSAALPPGSDTGAFSSPVIVTAEAFQNVPSRSSRASDARRNSHLRSAGR